MKKVLSLIAISLLLSTLVNAQPSPAPGSADASSGKIVLPDNSVVSGTITDNIRKKGELVIVSGEKKIKYKAGDISGAEIGNSRFITWNHTFYEVIYQGKNLTLLRKANEPASIQYSGSEAIVVNSEGKIDDLFIRKTGDASLQLLTKKNVKAILSTICSSCATDVQGIDTASLKKAVESCDNCK